METIFQAAEASDLGTNSAQRLHFQHSRRLLVSIQQYPFSKQVDYGH